MPDLITSATLNGGSITVTVEDDLGNTEAVSIAGGTNTYSLSNISGAASQVRISGDEAGLAQFHSGEVTNFGPAAPSGATVTNTDLDTATVDVTDESTTEDEFRLYRATSPGVSTSDTLADTVATADEGGTGGTVTLQDTGLSQNTTYYYAVTAYDSDEGAESDLSNETSGTTNVITTSNVSNEADATTDIPAPTDATLSNTDADSTLVTWTDNHSNGETRVDYRPTGASAWTTADTVARNTESVTIDGLRNGEEYEARAVAVTEHAETPSTPSDPTTTDFPDVAQPTLGNGVEDEIAVSWSSVINYGEYNVEYRETGASTWLDGPTVSDGNTSTAIPSLEDGEEYEVRLRTQTEHVQGAWTTPTSIVTKFPGITGLTVDTVTQTSVEMSWTDNADNEDGIDVERAKRYGDEWGPWRDLETLDPNTESHTDETAQPGREYRYRLRIFTEHTDATATVEATTTESGVRQTNVPTTGWYVEVDHPSGATLTPSILADGTEWIPQLNDQPRVEIAVPKADVWEGTELDEQPMRVWKDGQELPIDEVRATGREVDHDVIEGVGGTALEQDVEGVEYYEEDAHVAAAEVIEDLAGYTADVDDPLTNARENVGLRSADSVDDFDEWIQDAPFPENSPLYTTLSEVRCRSTATFQEAEDGDGDGALYSAEEENNDGAWSGNRAIRLDPGQTRTFEFDTDYPIPQNDALATFVWATPASPTPAMTIEIDVWGGGTYELESFGENALIEREDLFDLGAFTTQLNPSSVGDLPDGNHDILVTVDSGEPVYIDFVHFRDTRFTYNTGDTTPENAVVTGWEQYPETMDLVFAPVTSIEQVVAATVDVEIDNTDGQQALGVRNDTNDAWDDASTTSSHSASFAEGTQLAQAKVTLSRYDSGSGSGSFGSAFQRLDELSLSADLVNMPVLIDFFFEGRLKAGLNEIADAGDFIWEVRRVNGEDTIVFTQAGQRIADREPSLVEYSGRRTTDGSYQRVIAQGKSKRVEAEEFHTPDDYGSFVGLSEGPPIVQGTETVYDVGDRSSQYERLIDYEIDHRLGGIRVLEGGNMSTDADYAIDYEWRFEGSYTDPDAADPQTHRESFPAASSDRECEQLAIAVVREVSAPLEEATATIESADPTQPLTEAIDPEDLPFEGPLRVKDITTQPGQVQLTLGSRRGVGDVINDLNERLTALARNV